MTQTGTFQGRYVNDVRDVAIASLVSHAHMLLIGPPGGGKTTILRAIGTRVFPDPQSGKFAFIRIDPSTPPDRVKGLPEWEAAMRGEYVLVVENTCYDPRARLILLDELFRGMDWVFDPVLDVMDRQDLPTADDSPIVMATSNFISVTERIAAMKDRFTFRPWLDKEPIDVGNTVRNQMLAIGGSLTINNHLPDEAELAKIYAARPGENAINAVTKLIERIVREASDGLKDKDEDNMKKGIAAFDINYRRLQQWQQVLFRMSYYLTGDPDFSSVPAGAIKVLNWAWPSESLNEQKHWQQLLQAVSDPLETALSALRTAAYTKYKEITSNSSMQRNQQSLEMGKVVAHASDDLWDAASEMAAERDDNGRPIITDEVRDKINAAIEEIKKPYARMIQGLNPFEN